MFKNTLKVGKLLLSKNNYIFCLLQFLLHKNQFEPINWVDGKYFVAKYTCMYFFLSECN